MPKQCKAGLVLGLTLFCPSIIWAGTVYKCVENGKTRFTSTLNGNRENCQPLDIHAPQAIPQESLQSDKSRAKDKAQAARISELIKNDSDTLAKSQRMEAAKSLARQPVPLPSWGNGRGRRRAGGYPQ